MFSGALTALITPFKNNTIDEQAFCDFVEWQIAQGIHGLVPCGTTGECATLTHEEHNRVIELCVETAAGRVPVIAGTGSNSTDEAIILSQHAKRIGADGILVVTPYYNKPNQEGLYQHFKAINDAVEIPTIAYNIPGRSVIDMHDDTIIRLAQLPHIVGIKDATSDISRVSNLRRHLGNDFCQLSGEDATAVAFNAQGGVGCISVTANIMPNAVANIQDLCRQNAFKDALEAHDAIFSLHQVLFCETNPIAIKYAAYAMGLCSDEIRLPLIMPTESNKKRISEELQRHGLV